MIEGKSNFANIFTKPVMGMTLSCLGPSMKALTTKWNIHVWFLFLMHVRNVKCVDGKISLEEEYEHFGEIVLQCQLQNLDAYDVDYCEFVIIWCWESTRKDVDYARIWKCALYMLRCRVRTKLRTCTLYAQMLGTPELNMMLTIECKNDVIYNNENTKIRSWTCEVCTVVKVSCEAYETWKWYWMWMLWITQFNISMDATLCQHIVSMCRYAF